VNAALLLAFVLLNIEPMRSGFGRSTGLWSSCARSIGSNATTEAWSPWILVITGIPAVAGLILGEVSDASLRLLRVSRLAAVSLLVLAGLGVLFSTSTCMT
jgi:hypothetical protein